MEYNKDFVTVLADLKFIASCRKNHVMYIADRKIVTRSIWSTAYRKYACKNESGLDTVNFITDSLSKCYCLIKKYKTIEGTEKYIEHLIDHIKQVRNSITELKITYEKYPFIDASFDSILLQIDRSLDILQ